MKKSYKGVSKREMELIERLEESSISLFTIREISILLKCTRSKAYNIVKNLNKKRLVQKIGNGKYLLSFLSKTADILEVAPKIIWPSYISFWTALSYYKFTEQLPLTIYLCTTKSRKTFNFENSRIEFIKLSPKRFFGYTKAGKMIIAEKEKALLDSLLFTRYAGGIGEVFKCLSTGWNELDKSTIVDYALKFNNKTLLRRLGYLIEYGELRIEKELISKLQKNIGKGYALLEPYLTKKGRLNKRWGLIINKEGLLEWGKIR